MDVLIDQTQLMRTPTAEPHCPRCGYDMSGAAANWKDACELRGTCSECGFEFLWRDLFRPDRQLPRWLFEYTEGRRANLLGAWKTLFAAMIPSWFFARVKLWHAPVRNRILWWLPMLLLMAYVAATVVGVCTIWMMLESTVANGAFVGGYRSYYYKGDMEWVQYLNEVIAPFGRYEGQVPIQAWQPGLTWEMQMKMMVWEFHFHRIPSGMCFLGAAALAWPAALLLLAPTRRLAKIRGVHVLRSSVYSLWWVVLIAWAAALWRIVRAIDGLSETYGSGRGIRLLRELLDSSAWQELWTPIESISDFGFAWRPAGILVGAGIIALQAWWWHTVIVKHWSLPQGRMAFALIGVIAFCLAILATIGPMSIRYIFMN